MSEVTERDKLALQVSLAEYSALRKEIELRLTWQTVALTAALPFLAGVFLAASNAMVKSVDGVALWSEQYALYLGLASLGSSLIGLMVCNQDLMIFRIGTYIRSELAEEVRTITARRAFLWDYYHPTRMLKGAKFLAVTPHALLFVAAGTPLAAFLACVVSVGNKLGAYPYEWPNISHWVLIGFAVLVYGVFILAMGRAYLITKKWRTEALLRGATFKDDRPRSLIKEEPVDADR